MLSVDMKYTALYWALRFMENELDVHTKVYGDYKITIYAERQYVEYGNGIKCENFACGELTRHKDFVILECVDRLLSKGVRAENILINRSANKPDIIVDDDLEIVCEQWEEYSKTTINNVILLKNTVVYTSRLVSGLLEFKEHNNYYFGEKPENIFIEQTGDIKDFEISGDEIVAYNGRAKTVCIPKGITTIGNSAFWNNTNIKEIILPQSIKRIGGDAFYCCVNLEKINIPSQVWIMGNNPFAGCPLLEIKNESHNFNLDNGVLYDKEKTNIIHYTVSKIDKEFVVPNSVICLGKHCFFACNNLEKITVSSSVIRFENNPFSGCENLYIENHSLHYIIENGVIYNRYMTAIIGVLNNTEMNCFVIPETVSRIGRNSFWNCKRIEKIVITKNVILIGYNPFVGCENLIIESQNSRYIIKNGILMNTDETEIICCTNIIAKKSLKISDKIKTIGRGAFSGCKDLIEFDFNRVEIIGKSSFTNCIGLTSIYIPDCVKYIGEWAFSYCKNLKNISIDKNTTIARNVFNECPAKITWRNNG